MIIKRTPFLLLCFCGLSVVLADVQHPAKPTYIVDYRCTGGFAGISDSVTVAPNGEFRIARKGKVPMTGTVPPDQVAELARLLEGWSDLKDSYAPEKPTDDGFTTTITYGEKTVSVSTGAQAPEQFAQVNAWFQKLLIQP